MHPASFFILFAMVPVVTSTDSIGCGIQAENSKPSVRKRSIDGGRAVTNSWPWQVFLLIGKPDKLRHCGGSLLRVKNEDKSDIVVTAASCVTTDESRDTEHPEKLTPDQVGAIIGYHNLDEAKAKPQDAYFPSADISIHPDYKFSAHNDIAVIKLQQAVTFGDSIRPICLPNRDEETPVGKVCVTAGWGRTHREQEGGSKYLNQLAVEVHNAETCSNNTWGGWSEKFVESEMICAGSLEGDSGICHGDEGGMLACLLDGQYSLYGAASFTYGDDCLHPGHPGVFSRISTYVKWIRGEIRRLTTVKGPNELDLNALAKIVKPRPNAEPPKVY